METRNNEENKEEVKSTYEIRPMDNHIIFHGGGKVITESSIEEQNLKNGDSKWEAKSNAHKVSFLAGIEIHSCPYAKFYFFEAARVLPHSHSTGIFNRDRTINETVWNELVEGYTKNKSDEDTAKILTETDFYRFLKARRDKEKANDFAGKVKSNAEWEKFWDTYGLGNKPERYVTVSNLRIYYEDSKNAETRVQFEARNQTRMSNVI